MILNWKNKDRKKVDFAFVRDVFQVFRAQYLQDWNLPDQVQYLSPLWWDSKLIYHYYTLKRYYNT